MLRSAGRRTWMHRQGSRGTPPVASPASTECRVSWAASPGRVSATGTPRVCPPSAGGHRMSRRASPVLVGTDRLGRLRPLCATGQEHPLPRDCGSRPARDDVTAGGSPLRLMTDSDLRCARRSVLRERSYRRYDPVCDHNGRDGAGMKHVSQHHGRTVAADSTPSGRRPFHRRQVPLQQRRRRATTMRTACPPLMGVLLPHRDIFRCQLCIGRGADRAAATLARPTQRGVESGSRSAAADSRAVSALIA